jgi:hypothetical protein
MNLCQLFFCCDQWRSQDIYRAWAKNLVRLGYRASVRSTGSGSRYATLEEFSASGGIELRYASVRNTSKNIKYFLKIEI